MATIIDEKYRNKYKGDKDWLSTFIDGQVQVRDTKTKKVKVAALNADGTPQVDEAGKPVMNETTEEVENKKARVDLNKLFDLAAANGIDARGKYGDQAERQNAPGRLRMTIGNMLRAAARKRHGLNAVDGTWNEASPAFIGESARTENQDGSRIAAAKSAAADGASAQEQSAADGASAQEQSEEVEA